VISGDWLFGILLTMTAVFVLLILYKIGKARYDRIQRLVKTKEKEIELLTDLWKIDESEIEWLDHVSQGRNVSLFE